MTIALHYSFRKIDRDSLCDMDSMDKERVEQMYLKCCDLANLPKWIMNFKNLSHLCLSQNAIDFVPATFSLLSNINYLDISDNCLTTMSEAFFKLSKLRYLDVSGNFIQAIPKGRH